MVLHDGRIARWSGEGETLVGSLAVALNALVERCHVVTVNDYLA